MSYDISGLAGKIVTFANLVFYGPVQWGDPASLISLISVEIVDWGNGPLELEDYFLLGTTLCSSSGPTLNWESGILVDYLQDAIDSGKDKFQIRISNPGLLTNNNNAMDAWGYPVDQFSLNVVSYIYN